jgi:hypothetical protein
MYQIIEDPESEMQIIEKSLGAIESSIDQSNNKIPMSFDVKPGECKSINTNTEEKTNAKETPWLEKPQIKQ